MRLVALSLALLSSVALAENPGKIYEVSSAHILTANDGPIDVAGGAYLDSVALLASAKELAALRAENKSMRDAPMGGTSFATIVIVALVGAVAGGVAVALVRR